MMAWKLLFTSDMGVLSLLTLAIMLGMPVFIAFYVRRRMDNNPAGKTDGAGAPAAHSHT
jgi:hypothetical protein